jgi:NAD(P)H-flavin reductase
VFSAPQASYFPAVVENVDGAKTCAVLCGQKEMTEAVIEALTAAGVPKEKCIMNF